MPSKYYLVCWEVYEILFNGIKTWKDNRFEMLTFGETITAALEYTRSSLLKETKWEYISILYTIIHEVSLQEYEKMYPNF